MPKRTTQVVYQAEKPSEGYTVAELYAALADAMEDPKLRGASVRALTVIEFNASGGRLHTITLDAKGAGR